MDRIFGAFEGGFIQHLEFFNYDSQRELMTVHIRFLEIKKEAYPSYKKKDDFLTWIIVQHSAKTVRQP